MTIEPQMLSLLIEGYHQHGPSFTLDDYSLRKLAWRLDHLLVSPEQLQNYLDRLYGELRPIDRKRRSADDQSAVRRDYLVPLPPDAAKSVLERPLWSRHASELRSFLLPYIAINPVILTQLQEELSEYAANTWDQLIEKEELRLCRAHGLIYPVDTAEGTDLHGLAVRDETSVLQEAPSVRLPMAAESDGISWNEDFDTMQDSPANVGIEAAFAEPQHFHFDCNTPDSRGLLNFESSGRLPDGPLLIEVQPGISRLGTYVLLIRLGGIAYALPGARVTFHLFDEDSMPLNSEVTLGAVNEDPAFILQWRGEKTREFYPGDRLKFTYVSARQQNYQFSCTVTL